MICPHLAMVLELCVPQQKGSGCLRTQLPAPQRSPTRTSIARRPARRTEGPLANPCTTQEARVLHTRPQSTRHSSSMRTQHDTTTVQYDSARHLVETMPGSVAIAAPMPSINCAAVATIRSGTAETRYQISHSQDANVHTHVESTQSTCCAIICI